MDTLRITLNDRKRFVFSAATAALLVLLAGGSNALATTVWTVSKASSNTCSTIPLVTTCNTIGSAVSVALAGDIVVVGPGTYNETVYIYNTITLLGAQAGNDARVDRLDPSRESIVDATGGLYAIYVEASYVVIDGFTVQGATGDGGITIYDYSSQQVRNNILQNNTYGVDVAYDNSVTIEHNLFRNNNAGAAANSGRGIWEFHSSYDLIRENKFTGNKTAAIDANKDVAYETITNNTSENDGAFVVFRYTNSYVEFSHNQGKNFGQGAFSGAGDAAIGIVEQNSFLDISDNDLENGKEPIVNGVAFTTAFGTTYSNQYVNVTNNRFNGFPENGIVVEQSGGVGMLEGPGSFIIANEVSNNGNDGILIEGASTENNTGISLLGNKAEGNHMYDCQDTSLGAGPLGTNTWWNNIGSTSSLTGLCAARGWQH
jgi:parallel beta-helix repeat protein